MSFSRVFGGQNIYPSQLTLLVLDPLDEDVTLQWPVEQAVAGELVFADIMSVTPDDAGREITFPDARNAGPGQATLINNLGDDDVIINDHVGNEIGVVPSGEVWQFYLNNNETEAGEWFTFQFGTGASSAVAAALAGAGLEANANKLRLNFLVDTEAATPYSLVQGDRALAKLWTGGVGTFAAPDPATLGNGWFCLIRNGGTGTLTITAAAGYINTVGVASYDVAVGASLMLVSSGTYYLAIFQGGGTSNGFDFTSINVAGTGDYTLTGSELNRIAYRLTGVLSGNRNIIVPATVQQYWISNETTGAFSITVKTPLGGGTPVPQAAANILYCDGIDVVQAVGDSNGLIPVVMGGTGAATAADARTALGLAFSGATVSKTADQVLLDNAATLVTWTTEQRDSGGWHDNVTNNSRLTVPAGITVARFWSEIDFLLDNAATPYKALVLQILKNGVAVRQSITSIDVAVSDPLNGSRYPMLIDTGWLTVVPGDYFEIEATMNGSGGVGGSIRGAASIVSAFFCEGRPG